MYRIRLASGEEAVYRTAEELAQAVSSGVVSDTAEVFHKSAGKWLPINSHPDYRAVVTGKRPAHPFDPPQVDAPFPKALALDPQVPKPSAAPIETATPAVTEPEPVLLVLTREEHLPGSPAGIPGPVRQANPMTATRAGKLRIMLSLAMGLTGICLLGGGAVLAWPHLSGWLAARQHRPAPLSEGMTPFDSIPDSPAAPPAPLASGAATLRLDSIPTLYPAPSKPLAAASAAPESSPGKPAGEDTRVSRLTATRTRVPSYFEAYADARAEMDDGFDYVSFRKVFAPSHFAAPESLRATRRMVAAAGNILRVYRGREVMLEQTYRPDDPGGRGSLREPFETAEASRALIADVDSLFGLLVSQQGRFTYGNDAIRFQDPRTAGAYNQIRSQIIATLSDWRDSAAATNRVTLPRLIQAIGGSAPPPAH